MNPTPRPFIHINIALDEEGRATCAPGQENSISCGADWRRVHALRERYDAVAVGGRTWLLDSPRLNVRSERLGREPVRQPARVIFAGGHRCEVQGDEGTTFVIGRTEPVEGASDFLLVSGRLLAEPLAWLHGRGIHTMLVEGGPQLLRSFFAEGLADLLTVYVRTTSAERALAAARRSFAPLASESTEARAVGSGILLTFETPCLETEPFSTRNETALRSLAPDYKTVA